MTTTTLLLLSLLWFAFASLNTESVQDCYASLRGALREGG